MSTEELEEAVVQRAFELIDFRANAALLHINGLDAEANELDNIEWMSYAALETAVSALRKERLSATL